MKVAIPVSNGRVDGPGECLFMQIYEVENGQYKLVEEYENVNRNSQGRGPKNVKSMIDRGANSLIVAELAPPGFELVQKHNVKAYLAEGLDVRTALEKFIKNELEEIKEPTKSNCRL